MGDEGMMAASVAQTKETPEKATGEAHAIEQLVASGEHREAMARCARAYGGPLGRLCMAFTGSQAESEELVQETLLAAFDGLGSYRGDGTLKAWLFGIARRLCGRHTELRARRDSRLRLVHDTDRGLDAGEQAVNRERAERARTALGKLKPSEREAVVLRFEAGLSFRELGVACGIDEATARKRVSRALVRLRAELSED